MHVGEKVLSDPYLRQAFSKLPANPEFPFPVICAKLKLTWRCNLRCHMCAIHCNHPQGGELPLALAERTLSALRAQGLHKVHFSGGEALLYSGLVRLLELAQKLGLQTNLTTNGTLLNKEWAKNLIRFRTHRVNISIDSPDASEHDAIRGKKGAWALSMQAIQLLIDRRKRKGHGPRVSVNTVLTRKSVKKLDSFYELLSKIGVDSWHLLPIDTCLKSERPSVQQWNELAQNWKRYRPLLSRLPSGWSDTRDSNRVAKGKFAGRFYYSHRCYAPWFHFFVDADGRAFPCCMGAAKMIPYGNLHEKDVTVLLASSHRHELQQSFAAGHQHPICEYCDDFLEENRVLENLLTEKHTGEM